MVVSPSTGTSLVDLGVPEWLAASIKLFILAAAVYILYMVKIKGKEPHEVIPGGMGNY